MDFLRDLITQLRDLLSQQSAMRKLIAAAVLLLVLGFGITQIFRYARSVDYDVLYAGLDAHSARTIRESLAQNAPNVRHVITQDDRGWTIKVPSDRVLDLRLDMAQALDGGSGLVGWELFDKTSIGVTDFTQKINRQRAIQGELERTIRSIDVVKRANINLAMPEESVFVRDESKPKASVLIELYPRSILTQSKVEAIQAVVAGSIDGLTRENVTVADTTGRLLSRNPDIDDSTRFDLDQRAVLIEQQEKQRRDYESYLENKIESALSRVFGDGHIAAQVNVDFDFTVREMSELRYNPRSVPVAEAISTRTYLGDTHQAGGIVGTSAHLPPESGTESFTSALRTGPISSEESVINYNVGRTETRVVYPPYEIRRITAAVLVDDIPLEQNADATSAQPARERLTPQQITAIENQVRQIINFSDERPGGQSDVVSVTNMAFRPTADMAIDRTFQEMQKHRQKVTLIKFGLIALALILFTIFLIRPLVRVITSQPIPMLQPALAGTGAGLELTDESAKSAELENAVRGALEGTEENLSLEHFASPADPLTQQQKDLDKQIKKLAQDNPKKTLMVLRSWIES